MGQGNSAEPQRSPFDDSEPTLSASAPTSSEAPQRLTLIPTVLQWSHGGRMVYVTGTFNNWAERIPMRQSRNDFTVCLNLPVGTFQYKFIVDNEWRFSPTQPLVQDAQGNVNNCITVLDEEDFMSEPSAAHASVNDTAFGNDPTVPRYGQSFADDALQLAKDPPPLPSQLTRIVLNSEAHLAPPTMAEEYPCPLPCTLLHLSWHTLDAASTAAAAAADLGAAAQQPVASAAIVVSASHRFRAKFVTLVLYKPSRLRAGTSAGVGPILAAATAAAAAAGDRPSAPGLGLGQALRSREGGDRPPPLDVGGMGAGAGAAQFPAPTTAREPVPSLAAGAAVAAETPRPPSLMQIDAENAGTPHSPHQMVL